MPIRQKGLVWRFPNRPYCKKKKKKMRFYYFYVPQINVIDYCTPHFATSLSFFSWLQILFENLLGFD